MVSARSFFGYSAEEQEAAREAEMDRHQEAVLEDLFAQHPDKLAQLRERPWQAGWFVGQLLIKMGKDADTFGAWQTVLRRAFSHPPHALQPAVCECGYQKLECTVPYCPK